jgi:hypothetical protein
MLEDAGLVADGAALGEGTALQAWETFKQFARLPVEGMSAADHSDGLLFQTGVYDWDDGRGPQFNFSMVRQYCFDDEDGEYDHMEQVECLVLCDPTTELRALPREELWSFGMSPQQWFDSVEALTSFRGVVDAPLRPAELEVHLNEV